MSGLPLGGVLVEAARQQAIRLAEAEAEIKRLRVTIRNQQRRLYEARERQASWELRRQAWTADRKDLLRQLDDARAVLR